MSEWISIEEAAGKYSIKKEYIQLWVDMQVIISYFKDGGMVVSDESLRGFLRIREQGISPDYLKILEQFCIGRSETCLTYVYLLGARDKEIEMYRVLNYNGTHCGECGWNKMNGYTIWN